MRPLRNESPEVGRKGDALRARSRVDSGLQDKQQAWRQLGRQVSETADAILKSEDEANEALDAAERLRVTGEYRAQASRRIGELDPTRPDYEPEARRILDESAAAARDGARFSTDRGRQRFEVGLADTTGSLLTAALASRRSEAQRITRVSLENELQEAVAKVTAAPDLRAQILGDLSQRVQGLGNLLPEAERTQIATKFTLALTSAEAHARLDQGDLAGARRVITEAGRTGIDPSVTRRMRAEVDRRAAEGRIAARERDALAQNQFLYDLAQGNQDAKNLHAERVQSGWYRNQPNGLQLLALAERTLDQAEGIRQADLRADAAIMTRAQAGDTLNPAQATRYAELMTQDALRELEAQGRAADEAQKAQIALALQVQAAQRGGSLPGPLATSLAAAGVTTSQEQLANAATLLRDVESAGRGRDATRGLASDHRVRQVLREATELAGGATPTEGHLRQAASNVLAVSPQDREARTKAFNEWLRVDTTRPALNAALAEAIGSSASLDPAWQQDFQNLVRSNFQRHGDQTAAVRQAQEEMQRTAPRSYVGGPGYVTRDRVTYEATLPSWVRDGLGFTGPMGARNQQLFGAAMTSHIRGVLEQKGFVVQTPTEAAPAFQLRPLPVTPGRPVEFGLWLRQPTGAYIRLPETVPVPSTLEQFDQLFPGLRSGLVREQRSAARPQEAEAERDRARQAAAEAETQAIIEGRPATPGVRR